MDPVLKAGFYVLSFTASVEGDKRLIGNSGAAVTVKVMNEIHIANAKLSIADREQINSFLMLYRLTPYNKLSNLLEADHHQKIIIKFSVLSFNFNFMYYLTFVAEPDKTKMHKFDVDLHKSSKDFNYKSGKYEIRLIVADPLITNPVSCVFYGNFQADIRVERLSYEKRPEIFHTFRQPEKLPPVVISNVFTVLVLSPLLLLFILWFRIGANVRGFPCSFYAVGFHACLGAIFALYFVFWLKLNMFQTLKYLLGISLLTFVCGNRTLRSISERKYAPHRFLHSH
ncbi:unnamed protein product [Soboliphyme baturini]|uniref:Dolichyl-diphosphooligosaccharide--protein glycosyltransferase subunit 2 n=1 Tax=Soboliphyme baturini TaxID=241478 RepID=A0A183IP33_9BILA|nr:unnamed protein product [Soboliphyme baturini]